MLKSQVELLGWLMGVWVGPFGLSSAFGMGHPLTRSAGTHASRRSLSFKGTWISGLAPWVQSKEWGAPSIRGVREQGV